MIPRSPADFDIAIICALPVEFDAVEAVFDEHYDSAAYEKQHGDANFYRTGRIHQHNVVLSCLPEMGKRSAASVASSLQCTFTNIYLTLLVGICGGVPFLLSKIGETELILGDVIISSSIVEYDFGKQYPDKFQSKPGSIDTIGRDRRIRSFLTALKTSQLHNEFQRKLSAYLASLQGSDRRWNYPGAEHDRLYETTYRHKHHHPGSGMNCICDASQVNQDPVCDEALESDCSKLGCSGVLLKRSRLSSSDHSPQIHFGILGSGDTVMKSGEHRDELAKTAQIIGFEMEGAGVADSLSCLIIKGICDYADSHKNKMWQQYAAASAASCCKAFLEALPKIKQRSAPSFDEYEGTASEVGVIGSSERLASVFLDGTSASQHDYQWDFSSIAPDISDMEHHLSALQKELHRVKGDLANPLIKSVLVSGLTQAAKNNPNFLHRSHGIESFRLSHYNTKFGKIVSRTRIDRETIRAVQDGESCTHYKTTTSFNFHPASWLIKIGFKYGLETMITSSRAGWQYNILSVRAVPDDALVFDFCKVGNVDAVRELFGRGDASVLDVDSRGWRPLHVSGTSPVYHEAHISVTLILTISGLNVSFLK